MTSSRVEYGPLPERFRPPKQRRSLEERFWARVRKGPGCWEWMGSSGSHGYGQLYMRSKSRYPILAHRAAWEVVNGPIPSGYHVLHHCDNPRCVRPDHLFLGDHNSNAQDMRAKGRGTSGSTHPNAKLSDEEVAELLRRHWNGETQASLAVEYGVSQSLVSRWRNGHLRRYIIDAIIEEAGEE